MNKDISATLLKSLDLMTLLAATEKGYPIAFLAQAMNQPRSNIVRILNSLSLYGVVQKKGQNFCIQSNFIDQLSTFRHEKLRRLYRPLLEAIYREVKETVLIGLHEGSGIIHLDYIQRDPRIKVAPAPFTRHNLQVNALGKLAISRRKDLWEQIKNPTLRKEIQMIQKTGIAWNRENSVQGMIALAHPGFTNQPFEPMIAIAWPKIRFTEKKAREAVKIILKQIQFLSKK